MKDKQFAVIGLGRFGKSVARTLSTLGYDVLAIDSSEHEVQEIANDVAHTVQLDARDEDALKALGIRNFDVVIVAIGEDIQSNILVTVILKDLGVKYVVAKAQNHIHGKVLKKIGADRVIYPEKDMGIRLAYNLATSNIMDIIEMSEDYSIIEIAAPSRFVNKSIGELNLRANYGINVIAIKKNDSIIAAPGANTVIEENDILIILSKKEALRRLPT